MGKTVDLQVTRSHSSGPNGNTNSVSYQETIVPRLSDNDILLASDHPRQSVVRISRGAGYAQYGGLPFIIESNFHISQKQYEDRKATPWPDAAAGSLCPRKSVTGVWHCLDSRTGRHDRGHRGLRSRIRRRPVQLLRAVLPATTHATSAKPWEENEMTSLWTSRDLDIVETLTRRVRLLSIDQIARIWWPQAGCAASRPPATATVGRCRTDRQDDRQRSPSAGSLRATRRLEPREATNRTSRDVSSASEDTLALAQHSA